MGARILQDFLGLRRCFCDYSLTLIFGILDSFFFPLLRLLFRFGLGRRQDLLGLCLRARRDRPESVV